MSESEEKYKSWVENRGLDLEFTESRAADRKAEGSRPSPQQKKLEERIERLSEQVNELSRLSNVRLEKLTIKLRMMDEKFEAFSSDLQKKIGVINMRSSERPRMDLKIEELIEKHNQVVRTFESRLNQLKKVVEGQEIELYKAANELQEARKELARLKRL
jgi:hypothetical protein